MAPDRSVDRVMASDSWLDRVMAPDCSLDWVVAPARWLDRVVSPDGSLDRVNVRSDGVFTVPRTAVRGPGRVGWVGA